MSLSTQLDRWQKATLITQEQAEKITRFEKERGGMRASFALYGIGSLLIVIGFLALVASNWDHIPATMKLIGHLLLNLAGAAGIAFAIKKENNALKEILLFITSGLALTFIALIGQIYQTAAPLWQALTLWLVLITPALVMLSRSRFTILCWIVAAQTTFFSYLSSDLIGFMDHGQHSFLLFLDALTMIAIGQSVKAYAPESKAVWGDLLDTTGKTLLVIFVSSIVSTKHFFLKTTIPPFNLFILQTLTAGLFGARLMKLLPSRSALESSFEFVSLLFVSFTILSPTVLLGSVTSFALFMFYWLYLFALGHKAQSRGLAKFALFVLTIRIFIAYFELFGSLLQTGTGMIVSGVLLIVFVAVVKKIASYILPEKKSA